MSNTTDDAFVRVPREPTQQTVSRALSAFKDAGGFDSSSWTGMRAALDAAIADMFEPIAAAPSPASTAEAVAWRFRARSGNGAWLTAVSEPKFPKPELFEVEPLFASPVPSSERDAIIEMCAKVADREQAFRHQNMLEAKNGSTVWGSDPHTSMMAQGHKSVTAMQIARDIRSLKSSHVTGEPTS